MSPVSAHNSKSGLILKAYKGDNKTLLALNFVAKENATGLAGFTIQAQPEGKPAYFLWNDLQFPAPNHHAIFDGEPPQSSANAPFQKYRWTHFPGSSQQQPSSTAGSYTYIVTPRYFDANGNMAALDKTLGASLKISVGPFRKGSLRLGFTRGYIQSQAYVEHFGRNTPVIPPNRPLQFATSEIAGSNSSGKEITYEQIYDWMGSTARTQIFSVLNEVLQDSSLTLDMFAYDLDEPDIVTILLELAGQGRIRMILDDASLHVAHKDTRSGKLVTPLEVPFAAQFQQQAKPPAALLRGKFGRYAHDKILIVRKDSSPQKVLTGSTNFSVTGLYVNANHVLVFDDDVVAAEYAKVFDECWKDGCSAAAFQKSPLSNSAFTPPASDAPKMTVNFSPHAKPYVTSLLGAMVARINGEAAKQKGSVIFAVMEMDDTKSVNPVYTALNNIYKKGHLFSYGISDRPDGVVLYQPATPQGVLVTGKPGHVQLPPPFNQVPTPPGHEIHDKFVVCGLNGDDPVVYCGSSNLANGGEHLNGDNLLEIHDEDVAMAFGIEALALVDHYNFLDRYAKTVHKRNAENPLKTTSSKKNRPARATATNTLKQRHKR